MEIKFKTLEETLRKLEIRKPDSPRPIEENIPLRIYDLSDEQTDQENHYSNDDEENEEENNNYEETG